MTDRFGLDVPPHQRLPVAWYAPIGLRRVAREQLSSTDLMRNLDRRETFTAPLELIDLRGLADDSGSFWFDFIADTGDGGSPTYAVAKAALSRQLHAAGAEVPLPEGQLLILGGDLAYPSASPEAYQSRLVEMFELARDSTSRFVDVPAHLPHASPMRSEHKVIAAIPQNHDWLDSASTFCRYFVNDEKAGLIGARTPQRRTYFALALPHDWYVLGLDFALTGDLDRAQYDAFEALVTSNRIPEGANLILVYPEPFWTRPLFADVRDNYSRRYQRLEHLLATHGRPVRLRLAGDLHHYARERLDSAPPGGRSTDLVTCGCGGAFGHATHTREVTQTKVLQVASEPLAAQRDLGARVLVGRVSNPREAERQGLAFEPTPSALRRLGRVCCYPPIETSWRLAWGNVLALLRFRGGPLLDSNVAFALAMGALYMVAAAATASSLLQWQAQVGRPSGAALLWWWLVALVTHPLALAAHGAIALGSLFLAVDNDPPRADAVDWLAGALLGVAHVAVIFVLFNGVLAPLFGAWWPALPRADATLTIWLGVAARVAAIGALGLFAASMLAALVFGLFLALMSTLAGRIVNNASSALTIEDYKGFLRLKVGAGGIEAFMLGCDRVPRRWLPGAHDERPYWHAAPEQPAEAWRVVDRFSIQR